MKFTPFSPEWDKRNSPREPVGLPVLIAPGGRRLMTRNLSLEGCFLPEADLGTVGESIALTLDLPGFTMLPLQGRVIHQGKNGEGTGLEFVSLTPLALTCLEHFLRIFNK